MSTDYIIRRRRRQWWYLRFGAKMSRLDFAKMKCLKKFDLLPGIRSPSSKSDRTQSRPPPFVPNELRQKSVGGGRPHERELSIIIVGERERE